MTLNQLSDHVYKFSKGHILNGQKNTKENFRFWFKRMFRNSEMVLFSMAFPDGEWLCEAVHEDWGYDYIVPGTREEEAKILQKFLQK
jgi:hypothetical protein